MAEKSNGSETASSEEPKSALKQYLDRRSFIRGSAATAIGGSGLLLTSKSAIAQENSGDLTIGIVGCGAQGNALMESARLAKGFRFVAVADIWEYPRTVMQRRLGGYGMPVNAYADLTEMLAKEKDLDAVMIATPDNWHAPNTVEALEAGKKVYCEKMMSNTIEAAASMVKAQERTGGLLQIGHQRRSNPRYLNLRNDLFYGNEIFGRITHAQAQWNRAVTNPLGWPKGKEMDAATLSKYGYDNMDEFRNWRWYKKYGGGPISDLGAHQIDLFNWFFDTTPRSVIASGGNDYYDQYEHFDNVMSIYDYDFPKGKTARAAYQVLTTTSSQGFFEKWMGEDGSVVISESPASGNQVYREARADSWDAVAAKTGFLTKTKGAIYNKFWQQPKTWPGPHTPTWLEGSNLLDARATKGLDPWELSTKLDVRPHTPHIQSFIDAAKANDPEMVKCTVQDAFRTCVTVLSANKAIAEGRRIDFKESDFLASSY